METFEQMLWKSFCTGFAEVYGRRPVIGIDCNIPDLELSIIPDCNTHLEASLLAFKHGINRALSLIEHLTKTV